MSATRTPLLCLICVSLAAVLIAAGCGQMAETNEPEDFRGLAWGTPASAIAGLRPAGEEGDRKLYTRGGEKLKVGEFDLENITYGFCDGKLCEVKIDYRTEENYRGLLKTLNAAYGEGGREHPFFKKWIWTGEAVIIRFHYSDVSEDGAVVYRYLPLWPEDDGVDDL